MTLVTRHGSGQSVYRMSYQLTCERLRMVELDDYIVLYLKHLVESRMCRRHDSVSI
jgi:hypothetical protein